MLVKAVTKNKPKMLSGLNQKVSGQVRGLRIPPSRIMTPAERRDPPRNERKDEWREKGSSLNSASLTTKPLAPSVYVRASATPSPFKRSISVTSLFPSP